MAEQCADILMTHEAPLGLHRHGSEAISELAEVLGATQGSVDWIRLSDPVCAQCDASNGQLKARITKTICRGGANLTPRGPSVGSLGGGGLMCLGEFLSYVAANQELAMVVCILVVLACSGDSISSIRQPAAAANSGRWELRGLWVPFGCLSVGTLLDGRGPSVGAQVGDLKWFRCLGFRPTTVRSLELPAG